MFPHRLRGKRLPALLFVALVCSGATLQLWSQETPREQPGATAKPPAYDVVSIKPANPAERAVSWRDLPNGFDYTNIPLAQLVNRAYGISFDFQVSGLPEWAKSDRFSVSARQDPDAAEAMKKLSKQEFLQQRQQMLQALLSDCCHIQVRHESKEMPVYDLVIAKSGLKMKPAAPEEKESVGTKTMALYNNAGARGDDMAIVVTAHASTVRSLLQPTARTAGRIVLDKTGLGEQRFDYELQWSSNGQTLPDGSDAGPMLFKALEEQLGLKLEPAKEPVDILVVERFERPAENE